MAAWFDGTLAGVDDLEPFVRADGDTPLGIEAWAGTELDLRWSYADAVRTAIDDFSGAAPRRSTSWAAEHLHRLHGQPLLQRERVRRRLRSPARRALPLLGRRLAARRLGARRPGRLRGRRLLVPRRLPQQHAQRRHRRTGLRRPRGRRRRDDRGASADGREARPAPLHEQRRQGDPADRPRAARPLAFTPDFDLGALGRNRAGDDRRGTHARLGSGDDLELAGH